jgi:hypothetical protein
MTKRLVLEDGMSALDTEIAAYDVRRAELEKHHRGKWVVFIGDKLVDTFDSFENAAAEAVRLYGSGPYLIRQVGAPQSHFPASVVYRPAHADR